MGSCFPKEPPIIDLEFSEGEQTHVYEIDMQVEQELKAEAKVARIKSIQLRAKEIQEWCDGVNDNSERIRGTEIRAVTDRILNNKFDVAKAIYSRSIFRYNLIKEATDMNARFLNGLVDEDIIYQESIVVIEKLVNGAKVLLTLPENFEDIDVDEWTKLYFLHLQPILQSKVRFALTRIKESISESSPSELCN